MAATLTVEQPPTVDRLYFWALQVGFAGPGGRRFGGAHLGLQWYPPHPGSTAVNWGGYGPDGHELTGTPSPLPSATGNPNTRDLAWQPGRSYRLQVRRSPDVAGWRGEVVDVATGLTVVVRDLLTGGDRLVDPMVWSEVFAACDHPSVTVAWTDLLARTGSGEVVRPSAVVASYQSRADGGCANTESRLDDRGRLVQQTAVARTTPPGAVLPL